MTAVETTTLTINGLPVSFKELTVADTLLLAETRQTIYSELLAELPEGEVPGTSDAALMNIRFDLYGVKIPLVQVASANGPITVQQCTAARMTELNAALAEITRLNPYLAPAATDPNA